MMSLFQKQETTKDKFLNGKPITDNFVKIALRHIGYRFLINEAKKRITYKIVRENTLNTYKGHPTIFVVNHYSSQDIPIITNEIKKHAYILVGKQSLENIDNLFFFLYGSIFVDREDTKNKKNEPSDTSLSKVAMEEYLKKRQNLIVFPEGTWNLEDALLLLMMKWGIIDIAKDCNAQIVPTMLFYDRDKMECHIEYAEPVLVTENCDKKEVITSIRDSIATMIWYCIEKREPLVRKDLNIEKLREEHRRVLKEYQKLDWEKEEKVIFKDEPNPEEVFDKIKKLELRKETAFLFNKNTKGRW